ncbi:UNVERIFIED_CONTAM: hypothetical protein RMT77_013325 [Armadillidium vulgare]
MDQNIKLEIEENCPPESEENINEELYQKTLAENEVQEEYSFDASEFCIVYIEEELTDDQSDHNLNASNTVLDNIRNEYIGEESLWWDFESSIFSNLNEKKIINKANKANRVKIEKLFECPHCQYVAKRKVNLEYHLLKHANIKLLKCELCSYGCNRRENMKRHMLTHTKTKLLYCPICEYGCNDIRCLKAHILNHKDVMLYKSKEYSYETDLKGSLDKPILSHLNVSKCPDSLEYIPKENFEKYLSSVQSIQSTSNKEYNHETNGKGSLDKPILPHLNVSKCPDSLENIPKEKFEKYLSSVQSIQSSSKEFKCLKCDFSCNEKWDLDMHELYRHSEKLKCSLCSYETDRKRSLKRHLLTHEKTTGVDKESKRFRCSECPYGCAAKTSLQRHMLIHSSVKLFRCSQCEYQCNKKQSLQVHNTKHTNSTLFRCPLCSFGCNYKPSWKNHLLKKHSVA